MLAEILKAFAGESRQGGISWSAAKVIENYGNEDEFSAAFDKDLDTDWQQLPGDPTWQIEGFGPFHFLDAIGYRYYLPAAMVVAVHGGDGFALQFSLRHSRKSDRAENWSLLDGNQQLCIKHFLEYMIEQTSGVEEHIADYLDWTDSYESYWKDLS